MRQSSSIGIRWTVGDVSPLGFEALRLSIWGAFKVFGADASYLVCVNTLPLDLARARAGDLPTAVAFRDATRELPAFLAQHLDRTMAEGVGWKFAPLQVFPDRHELSLDNDCILWDAPPAIGRWLDDGDGAGTLVAEDVRACFGRFAPLCGPDPRNLGIRGLPPRFDLEGALRAVLAKHPGLLTSELDEQGLQVAALSRLRPPSVVTVDEVTICSPFPPHRAALGRCGAHFVGLNARELAWSLDGRGASDHVRENWRRLRRDLYERVEAPPA